MKNPHGIHLQTFIITAGLLPLLLVTVVVVHGHCRLSQLRHPPPPPLTQVVVVVVVPKEVGIVIIIIIIIIILIHIYHRR